MGLERYQRLIFARKKLPFLPIDAMELRANFPFEEAFLACAGGSNGLGSDREKLAAGQTKDQRKVGEALRR